MHWFTLLVICQRASRRKPPPRAVGAKKKEKKITTMAVSKNLWLRGARQRLGGVTLYQLKGQTVMRELAASVSNPQTETQQEQRTKLANVVALYRANRAWMEKYAFEGRPQKWSVYNAFVSANLSANEVQLTKAQAQARWAIVAPYIFTQGTLPSVELTEDANVAGQLDTNLYVAGDLDTGTATVGQVSASLLANNNVLREGMQISVIAMFQQQWGGVYYTTVRAAEIIIDTTDTRAWEDVAPASFYSDGGRLVVNYGDFENGATGVLVCLSDDRDGTVRVSTQRLVMLETGVYNSMVDEAQRARALVSYGGGDTQPFLAKGYQDQNTLGNEDVPVTTSILAVKLREDSNAVGAGNYIGNFGTDANGVMTITLNQVPSTPLAITFNGDSPGSPVTFATSGNNVLVTYSSGSPVNPSTVITSIALTFEDGTTTDIDFASTTGGGGVEE